MALNFMGLGFTFGAKDDGLEQKQRSIAEGFSKINISVESLNQNSAQMTLPGVMDDLPQEDVQKFDQAIQNLGETVGTTLPNQGRRGAIGFGRRGDEIVGTTKEIGDGFGLIEKAVQKLDNILRQSKLQTFIQSLALNKLNQISGAIGNLGSQSMNLTTSLEAQMVSMGKEARATGANFGFTGKALGKFSSQAASAAHGLNIGVGTAAKALRGFKEASTEMRAIGFKNFKDLAKFSEAFGVDADVIRNSVLRMTNAFGMSPKAINKVMSSATQFGQASGDVAGAINEIPQMMDLLSKKQTLINQGFKDMKLEDFAAQTYGVGKAMFGFVQDSKKAAAMASNFAMKTVEMQEGIAALSTGVGEDLPAGLLALGVTTGDISTAFDMAKKGPAGLVKGFADMIVKMKEAGKSEAQVAQATKWIGTRMQEVLGEDTPAFINAISKMTRAQVNQIDMTGKQTVSLGKLGKEAFRSGLTLSDSFERAEQSFVTRFRAISRTHVKAFVKETVSEFGRFGKKAQELGQDDGPLGLIIRKMSSMHQIGVTALIPKTLRPMATIFGSMLNNAAPIVTALGAMGLKFGLLLNPITLVAGALGGLVFLFKGVNKSWQKQIDTMAKSPEAYKKEQAAVKGLMKQRRKAWREFGWGSEQAVALTKKIKKKSEKLDFADKMRAALKTKSTKDEEALRQQIKKKAHARTVADIKNFGAKAREKIVGFAKALPTIFKQGLATIREVVKTVPWGEIWKSLGDVGGAALNIGKWIFGVLHRGFNRALDYLSKVDFTAAFQKVFDGMMNFVRGVFGSNEPEVVNSIGGKIGGAVKKAFWVAVDIVKQAMSAWWQAVFGVWSDGKGNLLDKIKTSGLGIAATLGAAMMLSGGIRKKVLGSFMSMGSGILGFFKGERKQKVAEVQGQTQDVKRGLIAGAKEWSSKAVPRIKAAMGRVREAVLGPYRGLGSKLVKTTSNMWSRVASATKSGLKRLSPVVSKGVRPIGNIVSNSFKRSGIGTMGSFIQQKMSTAADKFKSGYTRLADIGKRGSSAVGGAVQTMAKPFRRVGSAVGGVTQRFKGFGAAAGRFAAAGGAIVMAQGALDPLIDKLGKTSTAAAALKGAMMGAATGMAVAGPWGALIGGAVGAIGGLRAEVKRADEAFAHFMQTVENQVKRENKIIKHRALARSTLEMIKMFHMGVKKVPADFKLTSDQVMAVQHHFREWGKELVILGKEYNSLRDTTTAAGKKQRADVSMQMKSIIYDLKQQESALQKYGIEGWVKARPIIKHVLTDLSGAAGKTFKDMGDAGRHFNREAFQQSWATDIIYGFERMSSTLALARQELVGFNAEGKRTPRAQIGTIRAKAVTAKARTPERAISIRRPPPAARPLAPAPALSVVQEKMQGKRAEELVAATNKPEWTEAFLKEMEAGRKQQETLMRILAKGLKLKLSTAAGGGLPSTVSVNR